MAELPKQMTSALSFFVFEGCLLNKGGDAITLGALSQFRERLPAMNDGHYQDKTALFLEAVNDR
jgi:hypothetical protein